MWQVIKEFIIFYVIYPVAFVILYGGMLIALVMQRMREEDRARKLGF
jgi:hypothetical protein